MRTSGENSGTMAVLINLADETVRALLERATAAGEITLDEFNAMIGPDEVDTGDIEDTLASLAEMGIAVTHENSLTEELDEEAHQAVQSWHPRGATVQLTGEAWIRFMRAAARKKADGR